MRYVKCLSPIFLKLKLLLISFTNYYYLCLTASLYMCVTSVVIFVLFGYLVDDTIHRMAFVEIPFPSVVCLMLKYCYVKLYRLEKKICLD